MTLSPLRSDINLICVYNFKGGVAKTTTAHSLIQSIRKVRKIIVFDLDFQCNLTSLMNKEINTIIKMLDSKEDGDDDVEIGEEMLMEPENNIYKLWTAITRGEDQIEEGDTLKDVTRQILNVKPDNNLIFIPGTKKLFQIDRWLTTREADLRERFKLVDTILKLAQKYGVTDVLVDLNPGDSLLNRTILFRANYIVTPTFLDHSSISSTHSFVRILMKELESTGESENAQYSRQNIMPIVCVSKFKRYDGRLVKLHRKWVNLLERICEGHAAKFMLCSQIETSAMSKKTDSLYDIWYGNNEDAKITSYKANIDRLRDHVLKIRDGRFNRFIMDDQ